MFPQGADKSLLLQIIKSFRKDSGKNPVAYYPLPHGEIGKIVATEIHKVFDFYDRIVDTEEETFIDFSISVDIFKTDIGWTYPDKPISQWDEGCKNISLPSGVSFYEDGSVKISYTSRVAFGYPISAKIEVTDDAETLIVTIIGETDNGLGVKFADKRLTLGKRGE